jgi:hypothetical protein
MLRKSLIAVALLAASTGVMAGHGDFVYGRVVTVEPNFVISFSSGRHQDGFRILYESGGQRYWTYSHYHPGHVIWVPRPVGYYHYPKHHHEYRYQHEWKDRRGDWGGHHERRDHGESHRHWDRG